MISYQISVYASEQTLQSKTKLYERIVTQPSTVEFDYSLVAKTMRLLYGSNVIIQFTIKY